MILEMWVHEEIVFVRGNEEESVKVAAYTEASALS
jgi:hypothetical protein